VARAGFEPCRAFAILRFFLENERLDSEHILGEAMSTAQLKSGAICKQGAGHTFGAPRFSPYRILGS